MANKDDDIKSQIIAGGTPNAGQFVKGKSGNPRGRPKKRKHKVPTDSSVRDQFLKAAEAPMKLTENGKEVQIPVHDAIKRSEIVTAMKGSSHAQRNFLARYERFCRERMEEIEENHQQWRLYINAYETIVKDFADRREPLPDYYPHPDELHFPEGRFVTGWLGNNPCQGSILRQFSVQERDVWLLQCEKDRRYFGSNEELDHVSGGLALFINVLLPKAVQLDQARLNIRLGKQRTLQKPELQRRLTAAWAEIGFPEGKSLMTWPFGEAVRARLLQTLHARSA